MRHEKQAPRRLLCPYCGTEASRGFWSPAGGHPQLLPWCGQCKTSWDDPLPARMAAERFKPYTTTPLREWV